MKILENKAYRKLIIGVVISFLVMGNMLLFTKISVFAFSDNKNCLSPKTNILTGNIKQAFLESIFPAFMLSQEELETLNNIKNSDYPIFEQTPVSSEDLDYLIDSVLTAPIVKKIIRSDVAIERLDAKGNIVWATVNAPAGKLEIIKERGQNTNYKIYLNNNRIDAPEDMYAPGFSWFEGTTKYPYDLENALIITHFYLHKSAQQKGIGYAIMRWLQKRTLDLNIDFITVNETHNKNVIKRIGHRRIQTA